MASDLAAAAQALRNDMRRRLLPMPAEALIIDALAEICASITALQQEIDGGTGAALQPLLDAQLRAARPLFDLLTEETLGRDRHCATLAWAAYQAAAHRVAA